MWLLLVLNGAGAVLVLALLAALLRFVHRRLRQPRRRRPEGGSGRLQPRPPAPPTGPFEGAAVATRTLSDRSEHELARSA